MPKRIPLLKARKAFKTRLLLGLVLRPLRLFCVHCGKYVPSDTPWQCGYCNAENRFTKFYSFLHKCRTCKQAPKSFSCPHCQKINFLDRVEDKSHPASSIGAPSSQPPPTQAEMRGLRQEAHAQRKEEISQEIEMTRLSAELAAVRESLEFDAQKAAMKSLEKSWSGFNAGAMGVDRIEQRELQRLEEEFKDQPEKLQKGKLTLKAWVRMQKGEGL